MADTARVLIPVTTWSKRLKHWSTEDRLGSDSGGRSGGLLCSSTGLDTGYDQGWVDARSARWGGGSVVIDDLPACKRCQRSLAALGIQEGGTSD